MCILPRGGGERGLSWQRQARVEGKNKGLEDLRECVRHLFSIGISSPSLTALTAFSAGAVPVGALCNTHPHMMRAVILQVVCSIIWDLFMFEGIISHDLTQFRRCTLTSKDISGLCVQAPFLDVLGTMEDPSLPLTLEDREEWGDPVKNQKHKLSISSYCPLYNITPQVRKMLLICQALKTCSIYPIQAWCVLLTLLYMNRVFCNFTSRATHRFYWQPTATIPGFLCQVFSDTLRG